MDVKRKIKVSLIIILTLALLTSCGESKSWEDVLNETAPPDPYKLATPMEKEVEEETKPVEEEQVEEPSEDTNEIIEEVTKPNILFKLSEYPDGFNGAVRFYINGRYHDAFDNQGELKIEFDPGSYEFIIFDSSGKWQFRRTFNNGDQKQVLIHLEDRMPFNSELVDEEEEEEIEEEPPQ